ncbi:MAG: uracil-DNA glycosylase [Chthoniobacter sp.]|nr:uracil-DNA glycosylase [Chthoniobacter sp.]
MNEFASALDHVHATLAGLREQGVELRASAASLARLAATPTAAALAPAPLPVASPVVETRPLSDKPAAPTGAKAERLAELRSPVLACTLCPHLVKSRTQVVFGVGNPEAELMFVGEAPGEDEDLQGEPFVGKAGQLLTKIITAMGYARDDIYIANVLKCRPDMPPGESGNRKPKAAEMATCLPYLRQQIDIIQPRALVALGATAMEGLLGAVEPMAKLRGRWHEFNGIPLMATYHPAYLLRNQSLTEKRKVWEDMLLVLERLAKPISDKQRGFFLSKG